jgi:signal transduction histidine kinase
MPDPSQGELESTDWRADAFVRATRLATMLGVPAGVIAFWASASLPHAFTFRAAVVAVVGAMVVSWLLSGHRRHWRSLATFLVVTVVVACLIVTANYGLLPDAAIGLVSATVFATVFLGVRGFSSTIAATTLFVLGMGLAAHRHVIHPVDPSAILDWGRPRTWLRISGFYFLATCIASATVASLIGRLERGLNDEREARALADAARRRSDFLAEASRILASSLDYEGSLRRVAELSTPLLGDCCVIDLLTKDGNVRRIVAGRGDPYDLERLGPELEPRARIAEVARTRRAVVSEHATSVPLLARDEVLGALTFVCDPEPPPRRSRGVGRLRRAGDRPRCDLNSAEELGRRAAVAVDNGRLFDAAQQAVVAREELQALAAHEFRTPITSLKLALEAVSRRARQGAAGGADWPTFRMLDVAERQADNLNRLVETFLEISLPGSELPVTISDVDLSEVAEGTLAELRGDLEESKSALSLDAAEHVTGRWDRARVHQIARNLVSNAIKYGKGRPIEVAVRAAGDDAKLVVRDHGMGIPQEALGRMFQPFARAVPVSNYGGFGLGLYVVQRIVQRLGGTVQCDSAWNEGSTFTVTLPRAGPA